MEAMLAKHRLRWAGHLGRLPNTRLVKQVAYSELRQGSVEEDAHFYDSRMS